MSRKVDKNSKNLSEEDKRYLQDREGLPGGGLPEGVEPVRSPNNVSEDSEYTGTATDNAPGGGSPSTDGSGSDKDGSDYGSMSVAALKSEVDRRNEQREEAEGDIQPLDKPDRKAELIEVLEADDASSRDIIE